MVNINKTFCKAELTLLSSLVGGKMEAINHDEFVLGNLCIQKVGLYVAGKIYAVLTSYEELDFLWGEEGVASLHFEETDEDGVKVLEAQPPIKYVKQRENDKITDVLIVRDHVEEFDHSSSLGTFTYDKAVIFAFKGHQLCIELDEWGSEVLLLHKSTDALSKISPLAENWANDGMEEGVHFASTRTVISLKDESSKVISKLG